MTATAARGPRSTGTMEPASVLRLAISASAALVAGGLVVTLWSNRDRATARRLAGVAVVMFLGAVGHLFVVDLSGPNAIIDLTGGEPNDLLWVVLGATVSIVATGIWSLFAFRYAGRARGVDRLATAGVALLSVACLVVAVRAVSTGPSVALVNTLAVGYLLVGFLATVGVFLLLWASVGANAFPVREPLLLSSAIVVLLSGVHVAQVFERPVLYPAALLLAGVSFLVPVYRYPIFETLPAARVAGRDRVVDEMGDGILVADRAGVLQDLNPAAASLFDVSRDDALGQPISSLLGSAVGPEDVLAAQEPVQVEVGSTIVEVTGTPVTDDRDRSFGTLLVCTDVTDRRIREEQLTLLSRFIADIVHEHMADVTAEMDAFEHSADSSAPTPTAQHVWERTTDLTTLVAHARDLEQAIAANGDDPSTTADLRPELRDVADRVAADCAVDLRTQVPADPFTVPLSPGPFETVLSILLEDACGRAADRVTLETTVDSPTIRIRFDGTASDRAADHDEIVSVTRPVVERVGGSISVTREGDERLVTIRFPAPDAVGDEQVAGDQR